MKNPNVVRQLVREGMKGKGGTLANSVTVIARRDGQIVQQMDLPAEQPVPVFLFLQQSMAAMATAAAEHPKKRLVLGVMPRWKVWIIQHILRAI